MPGAAGLRNQRSWVPAPALRLAGPGSGAGLPPPVSFIPRPWWAKGCWTRALRPVHPLWFRSLWVLMSANPSGGQSNLQEPDAPCWSGQQAPQAHGQLPDRAEALSGRCEWACPLLTPPPFTPAHLLTLHPCKPHQTPKAAERLGTLLPTPPQLLVAPEQSLTSFSPANRCGAHNFQQEVKSDRAAKSPFNFPKSRELECPSGTISPCPH